MATKTASVKLDLKAGGYIAGLRDIEGKSKESAGRIGGAFKSAMSAGLKGAGDSIKSALSTVKSTIAGIGGLAGGFGLAEGISGAIKMESTFRQLANRIKLGTGEAVNWK